MVSDIMVTLELACRKRSNMRLLTEDDMRLPTSARAERDTFRWTVIVSGKEKLGVIPDRIFALEFTDNAERILCFLEADRGTMPIHRPRFAASCFERKFIAYEATWRRRIHMTRFGSKRLRVLAVTDNEGRACHLRDACASRHSAHGIFLFSTRERIVASLDALAERWIDAHYTRHVLVE